MELIYPIGIVIALFLRLRKNGFKSFDSKDAVDTLFWPITLTIDILASIKKVV